MIIKKYGIIDSYLIVSFIIMVYGKDVMYDFDH